MKWKYRKLNPGKSACNSQAFQNIFTEFEYIANNHSRAEEMAKVHNLVGTNRIYFKFQKLDLRAISHLLPNAYFEKQKFAAITIRPGDPVTYSIVSDKGDFMSRSRSLYCHSNTGPMGSTALIYRGGGLMISLSLSLTCRDRGSLPCGDRGSFFYEGL